MMHPAGPLLEKREKGAHPQLFRSLLKDNPTLYFPVEVSHPPTRKINHSITAHIIGMIETTGKWCELGLNRLRSSEFFVFEVVRVNVVSKTAQTGNLGFDKIMAMYRCEVETDSEPSAVMAIGTGFSHAH
jgi:hypothetical protein